MPLETLKKQEFVQIFGCWKTVLNIVWIRNRSLNRNRNQTFLKSEPEAQQIITAPQTLLKGTVSRVGYFFEGLNILISTFCVCANCFQCLSKAFH
jgi:hypothetical protein